MGWFWVELGTGFAEPSSEQTSSDSPTKRAIEMGCLQMPLLERYQGAEAVAQGRLDTLSDTGKSTSDVGVSHLFGGYTENHDPLPNADV